MSLDLLTEEEMPSYPDYDYNPELYEEAICKAQRLKTLRGVVKWMEDKKSWVLEARTLRHYILHRGIALGGVGDGD